MKHGVGLSELPIIHKLDLCFLSSEVRLVTFLHLTHRPHTNPYLAVAVSFEDHYVVGKNPTFTIIDLEMHLKYHKTNTVAQSLLFHKAIQSKG